MLRPIVLRVDASQIEQHVRQRIGHHWAVSGCTNLTEQFWPGRNVFLRTPHPERHLILVEGQWIVDIVAMVATDDKAAGLVNLLAVIRHIDDNGILLLEATDDLIDDGVVIERCVVIPYQLFLVMRQHLRAMLLVVGSREMSLLLRIARVVVHVLAKQMEDDERPITNLSRGGFLIPIPEQTVVPRVYGRIAITEHGIGELRVVQEETAGEVKDRLLCFRQELVGEEGHVVACLLEHFGKERIVAPRTLVANNIERQHVLEDEARQVPGRHDISKLNELSCSLTCQLSRRGGHIVAIELGVMLVIALADDQHDGWRSVVAAVHHRLVRRFHKLVHLTCSQLVGTNAKRQSIDRQILLSTMIACQFVFNGPDGRKRHQPPQALFVFPTGHGRPDEQHRHDHSKQC